MGLRPRADKRALSYGVAGSLLLSIGGGFWALPHIEDELDEEALGVASYVGSPGFIVEWNGRDGYLTVPEGTRRTEAESVAADLADLSGVRDVEIRFAGPAGAAAEAEEAAEEDVPPAGPAVASEAVEAPASFAVSWGAGAVTQTGAAPEALGEAMSLLGVADPSLEPTLTVEDGVADDLAALAPLIGTSLESGTATVDAGVLSISGFAATEADLEAARDALADASTPALLELAPMAEDAVDPAPTSEVRAALDELDIGGLQFETNTSTFTGDAETILDQVAAVLAAHPSIDIEIIGHADSRGDDVVNQLLSEARAEAVLEALVDRGVDRQRLAFSGSGDTEPVASNETIAGQQQNRRAEIDIKEANQ